MKQQHLDIDIEITRLLDTLVLSLSRQGQDKAQMKLTVAEFAPDADDDVVDQLIAEQMESAKAFVDMETQKSILMQGTTFALGGLHSLETMIEELRTEVTDLQAEVNVLRGEKKIITP